MVPHNNISFSSESTDIRAFNRRPSTDRKKKRGLLSLSLLPKYHIFTNNLSYLLQPSLSYKFRTLFEGSFKNLEVRLFETVMMLMNSNFVNVKSKREK